MRIQAINAVSRAVRTDVPGPRSWRTSTVREYDVGRASRYFLEAGGPADGRNVAEVTIALDDKPGRSRSTSGGWAPEAVSPTKALRNRDADAPDLGIEFEIEALYTRVQLRHTVFLFVGFDGDIYILRAVEGAVEDHPNIQ